MSASTRPHRPHRRPRRVARRPLGLLVPVLALALVGCALAMRPKPAGEGEATTPFPLFTAADALMKSWRVVRVWGQSQWRLVPEGDGVAIEPEVDGSSTALARWVEFDTATCPVAEWSWRVDRLPEGADLASRKSEDVAASIFFVFGNPGTLSNPRPVPTLRYVWSAAANAKDSIVDSPYFPGSLISVVVRSGVEGLGAWQTERRNLREDYRAAFGKDPDGPVQIVALYTDNDHLGEPLHSLYRSATAWCTEEPDSFWPS